jgi:hypothetical protein
MVLWGFLVEKMRDRITKQCLKVPDRRAEKTAEHTHVTQKGTTIFLAV